MDLYDDMHILDSDGTWATVDSKHRPSGRAAHGAVCCNRVIYIFGGLGRCGALNDMWRLPVGESLNQPGPWGRDFLVKLYSCSDSQIPQFHETLRFTQYLQ